MSEWQQGRASRTAPIPKHEQAEGRSPGGWFPCYEPERPHDDDMNLHDCCTPCLIGAVAAVANGEDDGLPCLVAFMEQRLAEHGEAPS